MSRPHHAPTTFHQCTNCLRFETVDHIWVAKPTRDDDFIGFCLDFVRPAIADVRQAEYLYIEPHFRQFYISVEFFDGAELTTSLFSFSIVEAVCPDCGDFLSSQCVPQWMAKVVIRCSFDRPQPLKYLTSQIESRFLCHSASHAPDAAEFIFSSKPPAFRLVKFVESLLPVQIAESDEITADSPDFCTLCHTYDVELPGIWKSDLVRLPDSDSLNLCLRVAKALSFLNLDTGIVSEMDAADYWQSPFPALMSEEQAKGFSVIAVFPLGPECGRERPCLLQLDGEKGSIHCKSHLRAALGAGDIVLGYDLRRTAVSVIVFRKG